MTRDALLRPAAAAIGTLTGLGLAGWWEAPPAAALSCFTVAGQVTCIEAGNPPPAVFVPPVIVPSGGDGDEHHIIIRDDGGTRVARG